MANSEFLSLLEASNPDYTGWPVWLDSRSFRDKMARPYIMDGIWEAFITSFEDGYSDQLGNL